MVEIEDPHGHMAQLHPCYSEVAHFRISRLHLPVARECNIQCNFCDRRISHFYHASRPGLTSKIIGPQEALNLTLAALDHDPCLHVVGIAGPGEPLFNPDTFKTLQLLHEHVPEIQLCVCTNGLLLEEKLEMLKENGVAFITVTINAIDPEIAGEIYQSINFDGHRLTGKACGEALVKCQLAGVEAAVEHGMVVKINTVLIPQINYDHILDIAQKCSQLGVYMMNIMPLIPLGNFAQLQPPTCEELKIARAMAETVIPQFRLCRQCRADACGIPGNE